MLSKQSVLPNFVRAAAIIAIASISFNASAGHHEKDMKKAKSKYMQKSSEEMHGDEMKDKLGMEHKKMESDLDASAVDLEDAEKAIEEAEEVKPE